MNVVPCCCCVCVCVYYGRGRIKFYTHPPEEWSLPSHVSADIVKEWGKAFDLKTLIEEEKKELSGKNNYNSFVVLVFIVHIMLIISILHISFCYLGWSSAEEGTAMAMESSHPLMEAFQGDELEEEETEFEEDMVSYYRDS